MVSGWTLVLLCALSVSAHICITEPRQRGALSVNQPGDGPCYRRHFPCGGQPPGPVLTTYVSGEPALVDFQQNLNHFYFANPGYLDVQLSPKADPQADSDFTTVATKDDFIGHDMVTMTNYSFRVPIPAGFTCDQCVMRFRYQSNNPLETDSNTTIFYQCSDIAVVPSNATAGPHDSPQALPARNVEGIDAHPEAIDAFNAMLGLQEQTSSHPQAAAPYPACCAPPQFTANGVVLTVGRQDKKPTFQKVTWYNDAVGMRVRVDRVGDIFPNETMTQITTITLYNQTFEGSPLEWVIYPERQVCLLYGADEMYPFAYGAPFNQTFIATTPIAGVGLVDLWVRPRDYPPGEDFTYYMNLHADGAKTDADGCLLCNPVGFMRNQALLDVISYFQTVEPTVDASVFSVPAYCKMPFSRADFFHRMH